MLVHGLTTTVSWGAICPSQGTRGSLHLEIYKPLIHPFAHIWMQAAIWPLCSLRNINHCRLFTFSRLLLLITVPIIPAPYPLISVTTAGHEIELDHEQGSAGVFHYLGLTFTANVHPDFPSSSPFPIPLRFQRYSGPHRPAITPYTSMILYTRHNLQ